MGRAGVGVTFAPNGEGVHIITALRPGGAAESCGRIVVNDILWGINNQVVKGMTVQQVIGMLTGAPGSEVTLMVLDGKFPYLSPKYCQLKRQTTAVSMGTHKK
jgi:C-terminal processing protease CtpA/Prc